MQIITHLISKAYQSLKDWLDPSTEGNPYEADLSNRIYKSNKTNKSYQLIRRRFGWNRFQ